jgi:PAS domain S-box-containing protein
MATTESWDEDLTTAIIETIDVIVVVLDREATIVGCNEACRKLLCVETSGELEGSFVGDLIPEEQRDEVRAIFRRLRDGASPLQHENDWLLPGGSRRRIAWSNTALEDEEGRVEYVVGTGVDVTELRELQRQQTRSERMAGLATVASEIVHEIRNPLNAASLQMMMLRRRLSEVEDAERLDAIADTVAEELRRVSRLLDSFLRFARPAPARLEDHDLARLIEDLATFNRPEFEELGVELSLELEEARSHFDPEKIRQLAINLIQNAGEATGRGGSVRVEVESGEEHIYLRVVDDGEGFEGDPDSYFEPFSTTREGGTGLGLSISKRIVREHGGELTVRREGDSTVVEAALPKR